MLSPTSSTVGLVVSPRTASGVNPTTYQNHVSHILSHTMEDVYRIQVRQLALSGLFSTILT